MVFTPTVKPSPHNPAPDGVTNQRLYEHFLLKIHGEG